MPIVSKAIFRSVCTKAVNVNRKMTRVRDSARDNKIAAYKLRTLFSKIRIREPRLFLCGGRNEESISLEEQREEGRTTRGTGSRIAVTRCQIVRVPLAHGCIINRKVDSSMRRRRNPRTKVSAGDDGGR